ncbi:MAG TPA: urease accessory protein UreD [Streptosporangiaceae bacterium]
MSRSALVSRLTARAAVASRAGAAGRTRITVLRSDGPIALRETPLGVYLVGTAAGPLGGDDLALDIDVGPGSSLVIRSAAGMLLLPGPHGGASALRISARVGPGGRLDFAPQPAVAADGCLHQAAARIHLAAGAALRWREEIVLGRHAEPSGRCVSRLDVTLDGAPAYRGELNVGHPPTDHSGAVLDDAGAVGSVLLVDAARARPPAAVHDGLAVLPLAVPGAAVTATARDAVILARRLDLGEERAGYLG